MKDAEHAYLGATWGSGLQLREASVVSCNPSFIRGFAKPTDERQGFFGKK
jgi:hypothetical protein